MKSKIVLITALFFGFVIVNSVFARFSDDDFSGDWWSPSDPTPVQNSFDYGGSVSDYSAPTVETPAASESPSFVEQVVSHQASERTENPPGPSAPEPQRTPEPPPAPEPRCGWCDAVGGFVSGIGSTVSNAVTAIVGPSTSTVTLGPPGPPSLCPACSGYAPPQPIVSVPVGPSQPAQIPAYTPLPPLDVPCSGDICIDPGTCGTINDCNFVQVPPSVPVGPSQPAQIVTQPPTIPPTETPTTTPTETPNPKVTISPIIESPTPTPTKCPGGTCIEGPPRGCAATDTCPSQTPQPSGQPQPSSPPTCSDLGGISCTGQCIGSNVAANCCVGQCVTGPRQTCGNNIKEGSEVCDGTALAGQTCQSLGFPGGTLRCNNACTNFDTSSCFLAPSCLYGLTLDHKQETYTGNEYTWIIKAADHSSVVCANAINYLIQHTTISGNCDAKTTGIFRVTDDPASTPTKTLSGFSRNIGEADDTLKIHVKSGGTGSCTLKFDVADPNGNLVDPTFTVNPGVGTLPPVVQSFDFSGTPQQFTATWVASYSDTPTRSMNVACGLNCDPRLQDCTQLPGQACTPYPFQSGSENPKRGSCTVTPPKYDYTQTNKILCMFYDPAIGTSVYTFTNHNFNPYDFAIRGPDVITTTVGSSVDLKVDIANNGLFSDSYRVAVTAASPNLISIAQPTSTTGTVTSDSTTSATTSLVPLTDSSNAMTVTVTSVNCAACAPKTLNIPLRSGLFSLPEFGTAGLAQIILLAALLYFLV